MQNIPGQISAEFREMVAHKIEEVLGAFVHPWNEAPETAVLAREIYNEALALGPLEDLLQDPAVTQIFVFGPDKIMIERAGVTSPGTVFFSGFEQLHSAIFRIASAQSVRLDECRPFAHIVYPDGTEFVATVPVLPGSSYFLRVKKTPNHKKSLDELVQSGCLSKNMAIFLRLCLRSRRSLLISGPAQSGKTTLLNALAMELPGDERICVLEESSSLKLSHPYVTKLSTRAPNIEGLNALKMSHLIRHASRILPNRIIIDSIDDDAVMDLLELKASSSAILFAMNAASPRDALSKMELLIANAAPNVAPGWPQATVATYNSFIVQLSRAMDGSLKVSHISEVTGMQGDTTCIQDIYSYREANPDSPSAGAHRATGYIPRAKEAFKQMGLQCPSDLFS